jgi:hypothetical protein
MVFLPDAGHDIVLPEVSQTGVYLAEIPSQASPEVKR